MRINVTPGKVNNNNLVIDGGGGFLPPPGPDIKDLFGLQNFEVSNNDIKPFQEVTVSWAIVKKDDTIDMADYRFRLKIMGDSNEISNDLPDIGSHTHRPLKKLYYVITAEKRGQGMGQIISEKVLVNVDDSDCSVINLSLESFHAFAINEFDRFISETDGLQKRRKPTRSDNIDRGYYEVETKFEDIPNVIKILFPFEINTPYFFDADLDVRLEVRLAIDHINSESYLSVSVNIVSDFDYDAGEHILSLGCTGIVSKAVNAILPMVMECKKGGLERSISSSILSFINIFGILDSKRLLSTNIMSDEISFVLCEEIEIENPEPTNPGDLAPRNPLTT